MLGPKSRLTTINSSLRVKCDLDAASIGTSPDTSGQRRLQFHVGYLWTHRIACNLDAHLFVRGALVAVLIAL